MLVVIVSTLACLPFLHPRMLFMALPLAGLVLCQAWSSPRRSHCLLAISVPAILGVAGLLTYNLQVSDDWLGHLRPGNAIPEDAADLSALTSTIPRYWLSGGMGLANSAPFYLLAWLGWGILLWRRDRRLATCLVLWATTGAVSGLLPYWDEGVTLPGRLLITALPSAFIGVAAAVDGLRRHVTGHLMFAAALVLSWESVLIMLPVPELGFRGGQLALRSIGRLYPWEAHFLDFGQDVTPTDLILWTGLLSALWCLLFHNELALWIRRSLVVGALGMPTLWGHSPAATRLGTTDLPRLGTMDGNSPGPAPIISAIAALSSPDGPPMAVRTAKANHLPVLAPGTGQVMVLDDTSRSEPSAVARFLYVTQRATLPAMTPWETRYHWPILSGSFGAAFPVTDSGYGTAGVVFADPSDSMIDSSRIFVRVVDMGAVYQEQEVKLATSPTISQERGFFATSPEAIAAGRYRAVFETQGQAWQGWLLRDPPVVMMAVLAMNSHEDTRLHDAMRRWISPDRPAAYKTVLEFLPPLVEKTEASWWTTLPFAGSAYSIDFVLDRSQSVSFLAKWGGEQTSVASLRLVRLIQTGVHHEGG